MILNIIETTNGSLASEVIRVVTQVSLAPIPGASMGLTLDLQSVDLKFDLM